jgi:hypothetical protein
MGAKELQSFYENLTGSSELAHAGVKGMKWGTTKPLTPEQAKMVADAEALGAAPPANDAEKLADEFVATSARISKKTPTNLDRAMIREAYNALGPEGVRNPNAKAILKAVDDKYKPLVKLAKQGKTQKAEVVRKIQTPVGGKTKK